MLEKFVPRYGLGGKLRRRLRFSRNLVPDAWIISKKFYLVNGFYPDLKNPKGFHEKICWLKLHGVTDLHKFCANKVTARDYVSERLGSDILVPLILITPNPDDLNPETIADSQFIIKANHDSGSAIICRDREAFDWEDARQKMKSSLGNDYHMNHRERQYEGFERKAIVEKLLLDSRGMLPADLRAFCFHGKCKFIKCTSIDADGTKREESYDLEWNAMPWVNKKRMRSSHAYPKPERLKEIIKIAETLAEPFKFCRVDLYEVGGHVFFAEMTFTPNAGNLPFEPSEFEMEIGSWLRL